MACKHVCCNRVDEKDAPEGDYVDIRITGDDPTGVWWFIESYLDEYHDDTDAEMKVVATHKGYTLSIFEREASRFDVTIYGVKASDSYEAEQLVSAWSSYNAPEYDHIDVERSN